MVDPAQALEMASTWEGVVRALRKEGRVVEAEGGPEGKPQP